MAHIQYIVIFGRVCQVIGLIGLIGQLDCSVGWIGLFGWGLILGCLEPGLVDWI